MLKYKKSQIQLVCQSSLRSFVSSQMLISTVHRLQDPLDELSLLVSSVDRLRETKIELLQLNVVSDGDIKHIFSAIPSLKIVDFRRPNYDADGFWFRFRRHRLHAEPEWIEGRSKTKGVPWWVGIEADLAAVEQ